MWRIDRGPGPDWPGPRRTPRRAHGQPGRPAGDRAEGDGDVGQEPDARPPRTEEKGAGDRLCADQEAVAAKTTLAATYNSVQDCTAATRVCVDKSHDTLRDGPLESMLGGNVADPFGEESMMGLLVSQIQRSRVSRFAELLTGGQDLSSQAVGDHLVAELVMVARSG